MLPPIHSTKELPPQRGSCLNSWYLCFFNVGWICLSLWCRKGVCPSIPSAIPAKLLAWCLRSEAFIGMRYPSCLIRQHHVCHIYLEMLTWRRLLFSMTSLSSLTGGVRKAVIFLGVDASSGCTMMTYLIAKHKLGIICMLWLDMDWHRHWSTWALFRIPQDRNPFFCRFSWGISILINTS